MAEPRSESPPRKRVRQSVESTKQEEEEGVKEFPEEKLVFLSFSDDIILKICTHLDLVSLYNLSGTCSRLSRIVGDKSLWNHPDSGAFSPSLSHLRTIVSRFFHSRTRSLRIKGQLNNNNSILSRPLFELIASKCPRLTALVLHKHFIHANEIKISDFPPEFSSLTELHLTHSSVINVHDQESYFKEMHIKFPYLRILNLSECSWIPNHSLLAICKLEKLEELSLKGCYRIGECFVYTALATRFGFRNLKTIDLRGTFVGNPEMQCIGRLPRICKAYFGDLHSTRPSYSEGDGKIEDRGIASLIDQEIPSKITHLSLRKTELTDKMLLSLGNKLPLEFLNVEETRVTLEGITEFKAIRPECKLVHD